jgi:hypothetical protein
MLTQEGIISCLNKRPKLEAVVCIVPIKTYHTSRDSTEIGVDKL